MCVCVSYFTEENQGFERCSNLLRVPCWQVALPDPEPSHLPSEPALLTTVLLTASKSLERYWAGSQGPGFHLEPEAGTLFLYLGENEKVGPDLHEPLCSKALVLLDYPHLHHGGGDPRHVLALMASFLNVIKCLSCFDLGGEIG